MYCFLQLKRRNRRPDFYIMKNNFLFLIFFVFSCCNHKENINKKSDNVIENSNQVVFFINNKENILTNFGSGIDALSFSKIDRDSKNDKDTIIIKTNISKKIYIKNNNSFKVLNILSNDTVKIYITNKEIVINLLNRKLMKFDTISVDKLYLLNAEKEILNYNKYFKKFNSITSENKIIPNKEYILSNLQKFRKLDELKEKEIIKKQQILSTIFKKKQLSKSNYLSELSKLNFNYYTSLLQNYNLTKDQYYLDKIDKLFFESEIAYKDEFVSYGYLNNFIINIILESSIINADYKIAFDKLPNFFKGKQLQFFREFCLHQIALSKQSSNELISYFNKYKEEYPESKFNESFESDYLIDINKNYSSKNVTLLNVNSEESTLQDFINKYKGRVIYIDFWASWCAPCIKEFPASKLLSEYFKDEDIIFVYISIDKKKQAWFNSLKNLDLNNKFSFLATNYPSADFYKDLEINTIPRYLLYNKKGDLIYENASRPSSENLKKDIEKLLN